MQWSIECINDFQAKRLDVLRQPQKYFQIAREHTVLNWVDLAASLHHGPFEECVHFHAHFSAGYLHPNSHAQVHRPVLAKNGKARSWK